MDNQLYDVAIIGGGLAGLSLAIQSADKNYRTILFEKESYPFHKVCGEYISMESWPFLESLGLQLDSFNLPVINDLLLTDVQGKAYNFSLPLGGFGISRYVLDHHLYTIALAKGVTICTNTKVTDVLFDQDVFTIVAGDKSYDSKIAAGCFGKRSNLDVKWKRPFTTQKPSSLSHYIGVKYHIRHQHPKQQIALHNFSHGYCGMSKIEDDKSCLCYLTTAENLRRSGNSIRQMEQHILYKNPKLKEIFTGSEMLYEEPLVISQVNFSKKAQIENHVLMLGDTAGLISPLCGNGMSMALHASSIAFKQIDEYLKKQLNRNMLEKHYVQLWKQHFSKRLWVGRQVQRLFGGNYSTATFLHIMKQFPSLASTIIRSTHGQPF